VSGGRRGWVLRLVRVFAVQTGLDSQQKGDDAMRDIAGQIDGVTFSSISGGVTGGAAAAFQAAYDQQLTYAVNQLSKVFKAAFNALSGAPVDLAEIGSRKPGYGLRSEHIGVTVAGAAGALGNLDDDLPLPPGASFGFAYSLDSFIEKLNVAWGINLGGTSGGRLDDNLDPSASGAIELSSADFYSSDDRTQLRSVITGTYTIRQVSLPSVPFTVTTTETARVFIPTVGDIHGIEVDVDVQLDLDTSALESGIHALEAGAAFAVLGALGFAGAGVVPGYVIPVNSLIQQKLQSFHTKPIRFMPFIAALFPIRALLPGTAERLIFSYDHYQMPYGVAQQGAPPGFGALAHIDDSKKQVFAPGTAFLASGQPRPRREPRLPTVSILGPRAPVQFPDNPSRAGPGC
jgi:hypothetical protein